MRASLKSRLLANPCFEGCWTWLRRRELLREYRARRDRYARLAEELKLAYREEASVAAARGRIAARGGAPRLRRAGEVHSFAFVPNLGWHDHLLPDLRELGPVTRFDYVEKGFRWDEFARADARAVGRRREMNDLVLPALREANARRPVDWVFVYASGLEISASTIRAMQEELGIPVVGMCLDDKQSWEGAFMGDHRAGQVDIAPVLDLAWTSARVACEWYLVEGGRPLYLPEGFDSSAYRPIAVRRDIDVSFVGGAYGYRPAVARWLRARGAPLRCFGAGWSEGFAEDAVAIFNRSRVNLGMGGIGYSEDLTNVKGRDFEIPGCGGGAYLTSYNADLARHFDIGREILCYSSRDELLEQLRYCLADPEEAESIARRGRERCMREHRWLHRYEAVLRAIGVLAGKAPDSSEDDA